MFFVECMVNVGLNLSFIYSVAIIKIGIRIAVKQDIVAVMCGVEVKIYSGFIVKTRFPFQRSQNIFIVVKRIRGYTKDLLRNKVTEL